MPNTLTKHAFTDADWESVQTFDCGDASYEKEVAEWLKGKGDPGIDSALNSIHHSDRPARVWLYKLEDGTLVGFGALAKSEWRWKGKKDPKMPITIIIWVGIQREFQGKPPHPAPKEERYSTQILDDLLAEASKDQDTHPVVGLFVHKDNVKAIKLYKAAGFTDDFDHRINKDTGEIEYYKMAVILNDDALLRIKAQAKK